MNFKMKIHHIQGSRNPSTDTNKLPDIEALILEKSEELRKLCNEAKRQCLIVVDAKGKEDKTAFSFWNIQMRDGDPLNNQEDHARAFNNLFGCIHQYTMTMTHGQVGLKSMYE
jgi:hypothetical protein